MGLFAKAEFERAVPQVLQDDSTMGLIVELTGDVLREINSNMGLSLIWSRIDELDEETLDVLAYDLHIDWWQYVTTLEAKRENLKNAVRIHSIMGTKDACLLAAELCVGDEVDIKEWYEYQGDPGYFKVIIKETAQVDYDSLIAIIFKVKRCSAWLEGFVQEREATVNANVAVLGQTAEDIVLYPEDTDIPVIDVQISYDPEYTVSLAAPAELDDGRLATVMTTGFGIEEKAYGYYVLSK